MPYTNVPDDKQDLVEKCVQQVMGKGHDKKSAIAICYTSVVEGAGLEPALRSFELGELDIDGIGSRVTEALSLDQQLERINRAWRQAYPLQSTPEPVFSPWIRETFDDAVIVEAQDGCYRVPYAVQDGEIVFAPLNEWEKVEMDRAWRAREFMDAAIAPVEATGAVPTGRLWEITIIGAERPESLVVVEGRTYIPSKNGRLYLVEALRDSVPLWNGVKVYDNHLTDQEFKERQGMRSVANEWVGTITDPRWDEAGACLVGVLHVVDENLANKLLAAFEQGVLSSIGLSIDTAPVERQARVEGRLVGVVEGFKKIYSVDVVAEPAAGGAFNRLIASQTRMTEDEMDPEKLKALIKKAVAEALAGKKAKESALVALEQRIFEAVGELGLDDEAKIAGLARRMSEGVEIEPEPVPAPAASVPPAEPLPPAPAPAADPNPALEAVRRLECRLARDQAIAAAKLPEHIAALVLEAFPDGRIFQPGELEAFIKRAKEAQAAADPTGRVTGAGNGRLGVTFDERDKYEAEFLRLVAGNADFRGFENATRDFVIERVPESYRAWINAGRPNYGLYKLSEWTRSILGGDPFVEPRAYEAVTTSGMASIVKNVLNLILANDYARRHLWWEPIVRREEVDTIDQATLVRVFGLSTLSVVDEGGAYTELSWADEEETPTFVKKGNFVGVTLETLLRDKLNIVRSLPNRLATAWYNTKSALAAAVFTTNTAAGPVLADTGALFNATAATSAGGHANLLTTALSFAAFGAARTAMRKQTDMTLGTGQKLLIEPKFLLVPVDLEQTAVQIRDSEQDPDNANNPTNPYRGKFQVVVVPAWTDANDWALAADPQEHPAIWDINLRGNQAPALFTADSELGGTMFTNDTLRYKVRMMTFRFSATYDCLPISDWRPLHKSNV